MDALADVLDLARVRGALVANVRARAPWGLALPTSSGASFHAVTSGTAWLRVDDAPPIQLVPGDLLLFATGSAHQLSSELDVPCRPLDRALKEELMTPDGQLELGATAAVTTFVCAAYDYDLEVAAPLFTLLPSVLHIPADPVTGREIAVLVDLLAGEAGAGKPGARSAAARLLDLLLIASIRHWARLLPADSDPSWLKALRDPTLAKAVALLHERPAEGWTLESLAKEVHLSRATLARRFTQSVGEPPLTYLTRWRMHLASQRLKYTTDAIQTIAYDIGYTSVYAFNRAFSRYRGQPPGRYRQTTQAA